ncbi:uncharacterized protein ISCGN_017653 [Ixodes scapularis]
MRHIRSRTTYRRKKKRWFGSRFTRDDKRRLWEQLALRLNALGPPTKSYKQWKEHWSRRVMKARKRAAQLNETARRTGGGSSTVRPLAQSLARILTLVGTDSALGAPGVRVPGEPGDQQERPSSSRRQMAAEPVPSTSRDATTSWGPWVRPTVPRAPPPPPPRQSRQERHDAAAIQAVEQQPLLLQQNVDQAAEEREFRGRLLEVLERISANLDRAASGQENTHSTLVQVLLLLASKALEQPAAPAPPAAPPPPPPPPQPRPPRSPGPSSSPGPSRSPAPPPPPPRSPGSPRCSGRCSGRSPGRSPGHSPGHNHNTRPP